MQIYFISLQWRIQTRRLGGQSNKGTPKSLHLFKILQLLGDDRWVSHKSGYLF